VQKREGARVEQQETQRHEVRAARIGREALGRPVVALAVSASARVKVECMQSASMGF